MLRTQAALLAVAQHANFDRRNRPPFGLPQSLLVQRSVPLGERALSSPLWLKTDDRRARGKLSMDRERQGSTRHLLRFAKANQQSSRRKVLMVRGCAPRVLYAGENV